MTQGFLTTEIEKTLQKVLSCEDSCPYLSLVSAARYCTLSGGKRLRPLFVLATAAQYEVPLEISLIPACTLELVHAYSLVHDDLPCMDDDDLRRGKPTLHKVYSEGHAVLTGDFLLTLAFDLLSQAPKLSETKRLKLIQSLSKHAGAQGMIGGQVIDLASEGKTLSWDTLCTMHHHKTASLFISALEFGAILGKASQEEFFLLQKVGAKVGLAFQILNDILDVVGSEKQLGKKTGQDVKKQKTTAVTLLGLDKAKEQGQLLVQESLTLLTNSSFSSLQALIAEIFAF